ncbi:protein fantom-like isoform X2 [Tubulanus polymorphus]|uniref:protein fantom-like isoform X2 n=1 Tax=Tubulanus polymorphus TaxID=672921 RepID=UPI003DA5500F
MPFVNEMMTDTDVYPVRDGGSGANRKRPRVTNSNVEDPDAAAQRAAHQRQTIARWTREDLEDKFLRMSEENLILKKHARKQEEKIKKMATKMLRLVSDKKKSEKENGVHKPRDVETEEMLEDLHGKIRELERVNHQLKDKLMVTKQQLVTSGSRQIAYPHVPARINTGLKHQDQKVSKNMRVAGPAPPRDTGRRSPTLPRYGHSLLEETRIENKQLERVIEQLNEQINIDEQDIEMLKEQLRIREAEYEEDLLKIKQQATQGQRTMIQENVDMIRVQREVKEKSTQLTALQSRYTALEEKLHTIKTSHDQVLREMDHLNHQLKQEQNRTLSLQNEMKQGSTQQRTLLEFEEQIDALKKENDILKEANEKLVSSAFDLEREQEWRRREHTLKVQIAQLEATLKADVGEKGGILDRLTDERESREKAEKEFSEIQVKYFEMKEELDEMKEKMAFFSKESAIDFTEIEEALMIVKQKREKGDQQLEFLQKVDSEKDKDLQKSMTHLQAEYAETINELEKTRNMLIVQHKINKDYQTEVDAVTKKMDENKQEFDGKLDEYARLLDIRAARIKKLEAQLKDVAYGTRQYKIRETTELEELEFEEFDESVHLERGQNLFEIHISKVLLSDEGLRALGDEEPSIFCTWEFYEFEIQSTTIKKGARPEINFTSQYIVKVDDFFLHHIQKESTTIEVHHALGTDYRTVAAGQLKFRDIIDKPQSRIQGTAQLTGVGEGGAGVDYGTVEFWVRLRVPMDQALRLYKERTKALGYLTSNQQQQQLIDSKQQTALDETANQRPEDGVNQLHINVIRCRDVRARREAMQPSPYAVYKFFDYNDHDTAIVDSSYSPEFNDQRTYPVPMTLQLDKYLKSQSLEVYIFDDTDPDETSFLGVARVPLLPLAHDKAIRGTFELKSPDGSTNGTIDIQLNWQYQYLPPRGSTRTPSQKLSMPDDKPEPTPLMPGEDLNRPPSPPIVPRHSSTPVVVRAKSKPVVTRESLETFQDLLQPVPKEEMEKIMMRPNTTENEEITESIVAVKAPAKAAAAAAMFFEEEQQRQTPDIHVSHVDEETVHTAPIEPPQSVEHGGSKAALIARKASGVGDIIDDEDDDVIRPVVPTPQVRSGKSTSLIHRQTAVHEEEMPSPRQHDDIPADTAAAADDDDQDLLKAKNVLRKALIRKRETKSTGKEDKKKKEKKKDKKKDEMRSGEKTQEDTMFGDEPDKDATDIEEEIESEVGADMMSIESDSEGVIVISQKTPRPASRLDRANTVKVTISHLSLEENSSISTDPDIQLLFVEYRFLGVAADELETPFSLPKPKPHDRIYFNFEKVFHVDPEENYEKRQYLASMLLPDDPDDGRMKLIVVSEPTEDNPDAECEDVGIVFVSIPQILKTGKDLINEEAEIVDMNDESTVIGHLNVSVECLDALRAIQHEM